jgi:ferrous iron transport protein A
VTVLNLAPMGDPIEIRIRGYQLSLRQSEARHVTIAAE